MKTLNGQMVCGISPVGEEKVYGGKDLPTIRVRIKWHGGWGWVNRSEHTSNSGRFISYISALLVPWITPCDRGFHTRARGYHSSNDYNRMCYNGRYSNTNCQIRSTISTYRVTFWGRQPLVQVKINRLQFSQLHNL